VFELYTCRTEVELIMGVGKAGKVVFVGPCEVIAIIEVGGAGDDQGWDGVERGGIMGRLCGAGKRKCCYQNGKEGNFDHLDSFG
jgi:hypothetical protein